MSTTWISNQTSVCANFVLFQLTFLFMVRRSIAQALKRWQWCWSHRYVGDFMMVTDLTCWCQNHYVSDLFRYFGDIYNVLNRSPTSQICHQHFWSSTYVTNINLTLKWVLIDIRSGGVSETGLNLIVQLNKQVETESRFVLKLLIPCLFLVDISSSTSISNL